MLAIFVGAVLLGLITGAIAYCKGHSFLLWWLFGTGLLIVALPLVLFQKPNVRELERRRMRNENLRKCLFCAELIKNEAVVCRFCGRDVARGVERLDDQTRPPPNELSSLPHATPSCAAALSAAPPRPRPAVGFVLLTAVALLVAISWWAQPQRISTGRTPRSTTIGSGAAGGLLGARVVYPKSMVNLRTGPGTGFPVARQAQRGEHLPYDEVTGNWYKLSLPDEDRDLYVHKNVVITESERKLRQEAQLGVDEWHWRRDLSFVTVEGRVTNVSDHRLERVSAVVSFEDGSGRFITSASALIDDDPLMPGQTSRWEVIVNSNPAMKKARVEFKEMLGETLTAYYD